MGSRHQRRRLTLPDPTSLQSSVANNLLEFGRAAASFDDPSGANANVILTPLPMAPPSLLGMGVAISEAGLGLLVTDKGKEVFFSFSSGPSSSIDHAILDRHAVLPLITLGDPSTFHPDWGIHIKQLCDAPGVTLKMLEKITLSCDAFFAS